MTAAIENARRALADIEAKKAAADAERNKLAALRRQKVEEDEERVALRAAEEEDAARRIVDGDDAAPERPRRRNRQQKLDDNAPALVAAIKLQENRVAEAEAAVAPMLTPLAAASLHVVVDVQGEALAEIRQALAAIAQPAARLLAADQIMAGTVGTGRFPVPRGAPMPINGAHVLSALLKGIPEHLRPTELGTDALGAAAREISQPILSQIRGNDQ